VTGHDALLEIEHLRVESRGGLTRQVILDEISLDIGFSEMVGVVGESGSGKSTLARVIARLLPRPLHVTSGTVRLHGRDILGCSPTSLHRMRGGGVSLVFQNPVSALNPSMTIGEQVAEALRAHGISRRGARDRGVELLQRMGVEDAGARLTDYPHQFSGGQRQRIVIAIAIATEPALLLADEPTSALDVTTQAAILDLFSEVSRERGMSVLLISHNYAVVSQMCSRTVVLYAGRILETGATQVLLQASHHPYTRGLIASLPALDHRVNRLQAIAGSPPRPGEQLQGCPFKPRCGYAVEACAQADMALAPVDGHHSTACIRAAELFPDKSGALDGAARVKGGRR
jgi:oligopeptide/dipeptide ABC transporter ATP-binding protein